jgi:hypothetical protein
MRVAVNEGVSWGYYNNITKQEPPCCWGITEDKNRLFADAVADMFGIKKEGQYISDQLYLQ